MVYVIDLNVSFCCNRLLSIFYRVVLESTTLGWHLENCFFNQSVWNSGLKMYSQKFFSLSQDNISRKNRFMSEHIIKYAWTLGVGRSKFLIWVENTVSYKHESSLAISVLHLAKLCDKKILKCLNFSLSHALIENCKTSWWLQLCLSLNFNFCHHFNHVIGSFKFSDLLFLISIERK